MFELAAPIVELYAGGQRIETTAEHPFYVANEGWVRAHELRPGDWLLGHDGAVTPVERIFKADRTATVYNLRVAHDHTYFVGSRAWGFSLWAHNAYVVQRLTDGTFAVFDRVGGQIVQSGFAKEADAAAFAALKKAEALEIEETLRLGKAPSNKLFGNLDFNGLNGKRVSLDIHPGGNKYTVLADVKVLDNGKTLMLDEVGLFPTGTPGQFLGAEKAPGLGQGGVFAITKELADQARAQGFKKLIIEGKLMDKGMKPFTKVIPLE